MIAELGAEGARMEEEAGGRLWCNAIPSSKKKKPIPWTTKVQQAIKLESTESITAENQCTVDFFSHYNWK